MSRSMPKPKIIYKNLEDIIRNSSYSKSHAKHLTPNKPSKTKIHTISLQSTQVIPNQMKRSSSRHSLNSKEKLIVCS